MKISSLFHKINSEIKHKKKTKQKKAKSFLFSLFFVYSRFFFLFSTGLLPFPECFASFKIPLVSNKLLKKKSSSSFGTTAPSSLKGRCSSPFEDQRVLVLVLPHQSLSKPSFLLVYSLKSNGGATYRGGRAMAPP